MTTADILRTYARANHPIDHLRRYAAASQPHPDHAGFLRAIEANPNDTTAIRAYSDFHRDLGLPHTADFILRAANIDDPREYNHRFSSVGSAVPSDAPPDAERHVGLFNHGVLWHGPRWAVELWQRSPDKRNVRWTLYGQTPEEALDWERRLASEGASVPLYRRFRGNPYRPKPRL